MNPKWLGLLRLAQDAVDHGSRAIEKVHLQSAQRPFFVLEQIPAIAGTVQLVHVLHDALVTTTYSAVRLVNRSLIGPSHDDD